MGSVTALAVFVSLLISAIEAFLPLLHCNIEGKCFNFKTHLCSAQWMWAVAENCG